MFGDLNFFWWIIIVLGIGGISFFLAWRSMRDYQEQPDKSLDYSLFLVRNPDHFTQEALKKIYDAIVSDQLIFSIEKLLKGLDQALVLYIPRLLVDKLPELALFELEDYLGSSSDKNQSSRQSQSPQKIGPSQAYTWTMTLSSSIKVDRADFFKQFGLDTDQYFFWQIVCYPVKNPLDNFQIVARAMLVEKEAARRIDMVKNLAKQIEDKLDLKRKIVTKSNKALFEEYQKRILAAKEDKPTVLNIGQVLGLIS